MRRRITPIHSYFALIVAATAATVARPYFAAGPPLSPKKLAAGPRNRHPLPKTRPARNRHLHRRNEGPNPTQIPTRTALKIPTLPAKSSAMARRATASSPSLPTVTYPSHTAMMTGVNPGTHGIVTNPAWDPFGQKLQRLPLVRRRHPRPPRSGNSRASTVFRTALIHWPRQPSAAQADIIVPEIWRANIPEDLNLLRATFHARHFSKRSRRNILISTRASPRLCKTDGRLHRRRLLRDQEITAESAPPSSCNG